MSCLVPGGRWNRRPRSTVMWAQLLGLKSTWQWALGVTIYPSTKLSSSQIGSTFCLSASFCRKHIPDCVFPFDFVLSKGLCGHQDPTWSFNAPLPTPISFAPSHQRPGSSASSIMDSPFHQAIAAVFASTFASAFVSLRRGSNWCQIQIFAYKVRCPHRIINQASLLSSAIFLQGDLYPRDWN